MQAHISHILTIGFHNKAKKPPCHQVIVSTTQPEIIDVATNNRSLLTITMTMPAAYAISEATVISCTGKMRGFMS
jgi:hypothetical protein